MAGSCPKSGADRTIWPVGRPSDTTALADELSSAVTRIRHRLREETGLDDVGLSLSQLTLLNVLDKDGPRTASELAAGEHVSPQAIAQALAPLKAKGFVTTQPHPDDRRKTLLAISDQGRALRASLRDSRLRWLVQALDETLDAGERRTLREAAALLARLAAAGGK